MSIYALRIRVKDVKFSYHVDDVFEKDIPVLQHGNDGLIYTCVNTPYVAGTDPNMWLSRTYYPACISLIRLYALSCRLKWKPPSENSIDFKLVLRFPPSPEDESKPDFYAKPIFELHTWCGGKLYEFWDTLFVKDDEWEQ